MSVSSASNGTLFFSFQRRIGMASSEERGNSSKCCRKTRITGPGMKRATSSSFARRRLQTVVIALRTAAGFTMLASTAEGTTAPGGNGSTANPSKAPLRDHRAPEMRSGAISQARCGCGIASSQSAMRRPRPVLYIPCRNAVALLNEGYLVDFANGGQTGADLRQSAFTQRYHALFPGHALDLRGRPAVHNHLADVVSKVHQLANRGPAVIASAGTFQAAGAFGEDHVSPLGRIEARFLEFVRRVTFGSLAVFADDANQPLGQDAVQGADKVVWLDAHVDEAADDVGHVVGVNSGEEQVAGERGLDGDLRGFLVADFAHHDLVRIVAEDGTQTARESKPLLLIDRNLRDAANLVFHRVFNRDELVFVGLDLIDGRIQRRGLAGARRAGYEDHAVRLTNVAAKTPEFFGGETDDVQTEVPKLFGQGFLVEDAKHGVFAVTRGHDGHAKIDVAALVADPEPAVLRHAALRNIQFAQDFDARDDRRMPFLGDGRHGVLKNAVNPVFHDHFSVAGFDVDVAGAALERGEDDRFHEANDRAGRGLAG